MSTWNLAATYYDIHLELTTHLSLSPPADVRYERVKYLMNTFQIVNWHQANKIYEGDLTPILGQ